MEGPFRINVPMSYATENKCSIKTKTFMRTFMGSFCRLLEYVFELLYYYISAYISQSQNVIFQQMHTFRMIYTISDKKFVNS